MKTFKQWISKNEKIIKKRATWIGITALVLILAVLLFGKTEKQVNIALSEPVLNYTAFNDGVIDKVYFSSGSKIRKSDDIYKFSYQKGSYQATIDVESKLDFDDEIEIIMQYDAKKFCEGANVKKGDFLFSLLMSSDSKNYAIVKIKNKDLLSIADKTTLAIKCGDEIKNAKIEALIAYTQDEKSLLLSIDKSEGDLSRGQYMLRKEQIRLIKKILKK